MRTLVPGWATGPLRHLHTLPTPSGPPTLPPHTRLGLLEQLWPDHNQPVESTNFIAFTTQSPLAHNILALHRLGCRGLILHGTQIPERHALVVARALHFPVVLTSQALQAAGATILLQAKPQQVSVQEAPAQNLWIEGCQRVFPRTALPDSTQEAWLELAAGQPEELHLAQQLLQERRITGMGLLRLEFVCYDDPGMDVEDLTLRLEKVLRAFPHHPVAIRLTEWTADKPPPPGAPMAEGLTTEMDLAMMLGAPAFDLQCRALIRAQASCQHQEVWVITPCVKKATDLAQCRERLPSVFRLGVMVESWQSLAQAKSMAVYVEGFWVGLGDLSRDGEFRGGALIEFCEAWRETHCVVLCGPAPGGVSV